MGRIPDDLIDRLKREISLERLVEAAGVTLKRHGADLLGLCPFHDDHEPSLVISLEQNLWHCLGACQAGGSVIDWVMRREGVSFRHAVERLKDELAGASPPLAAAVKTAPLPVAADADDQTALREVLDYYHETLKQSPEALEYLTSRGLNHPELIDTFRLGYANRTLGYRLPPKNRQAGAELRGRLQAVGLLRESGHEHFNGSLVVPVMDEAGAILEVYGRKILNNLRPGTAYHLYLPGPHRGVWNAAALGASEEVILCEALIDAMTFWVHGFHNVTASYGIEGFTADHLAAFKRHDIKRVLIAYDRDEAGNAAAAKLAERLMAEGFECFRVLFPKGMDANEYALKVTPAGKSLGLALRKAEWLGKGRAPTRPEAPEVAAPDPLPPLAAEPAPSEPPALPPTPAIAVVSADAEVTEHEVNMTFGERHYRVRGLHKNLSYEQLKLNVLIRHGQAFHVDTLDLYSARHRAAYLKQAGAELGLAEDLIKADLGQLLLKCEELQEQLIKGTLARQSRQPVMADEEVKAALALLKSPDLISRILADFARCGVVGEEVNKQVAYLAAVSRKLERPLAVMVQSSSAAGKSSLMDAVLAFMPEEERIHYSAMTGQSLFYMGEQDLKHKILAISEEEGAHNTSYALKLLQSEGEVSIASTGKNALTGNLETQEYRVEGPVMLFSTTTAIDIDEELLNRCLVLAVDESRAQTEAIHAAQRKRRTLEGLRARQDRQHLTRLHQNAQRLLRSLRIVNPYAEALTFLSDKTRTRRDHEKYLGLIDAIALLHQYQREVKRERYAEEVIEYIEVSREDIALANRLAHEVLGRTLDELPPQTRKLLELIHGYVLSACQREGIERNAYRFSRKQIREATGWGNTQLKVHIGRLEELEYLIAHGGGRGRSIAYELLYNGEGQNGPFLMGLIDVAALGSATAPGVALPPASMQSYDERKSGAASGKAGPSRPPVGVRSASSRGEENGVKPDGAGVGEETPENAAERASLRSGGASHRSAISPLAAREG